MIPHYDRTKKSCGCEYLPLSHTKPKETFLRLCMGQREVLAVHDFSVLSCSLLNLAKTKLYEVGLASPCLF